MDDFVPEPGKASDGGSDLVERLCVALGLACLVLAVIFAAWRGALPFTGVIARFARLDEDATKLLPATDGNLRYFYHLSGTIWLTLAGVVLLLPTILRRTSARVHTLLWRLTATFACACAVLLFLARTPEGPWSPIAVLMAHPGTEHNIGHRLLFVWVADFVHLLRPTMSPLHCYLASQLVATLLALYATERWAALLVGESLAWLGQVLAAVMVSVCFIYLTFYDIGIVFFFSCGLIALLRRRYAWFAVVVTVGTLNHENILLLIPIAVALLYDAEPVRVWFPPVAAALAGHVLVRMGLQYALPFHQMVDWRIWTNLVKPVIYWKAMLISLMALTGWYGLGLLSLPPIDARLRRLVLLFPMLVAVTLAFGQFHEPRQFDAFIPVLVAFLLLATRARLLNDPALAPPQSRYAEPPTPRPTSHAAPETQTVYTSYS